MSDTLKTGDNEQIEPGKLYFRKAWNNLAVSSSLYMWADAELFSQPTRQACYVNAAKF